MIVTEVTGKQEGDGYSRHHEAWPKGPWYYRTGKTPVAATRLMLFAIAPTSRGPLDWPDQTVAHLFRVHPGLRHFVMTGEWEAD